MQIDYSAPGVRLRLKYATLEQQVSLFAAGHHGLGIQCVGRFTPNCFPICPLATGEPKPRRTRQAPYQLLQPQFTAFVHRCPVQKASSHSPTLGYRLSPYLPRDANPIGTLHIGKYQYTCSIAPTCSKRLTVESWQHACSYSLKNRMPSVATIHDFLGKVQYPSSHLCFHGQSATLRELWNRDRVHLLLLPERWPRHIFP